MPSVVVRYTRRSPLFRQSGSGGCLGRLLPLGVDADQAADGTGDTDNTIVEACPAQRGRGDGQVTDVGEELEAAGGAFPAER